jgi:hypothetical protein
VHRAPAARADRELLDQQGSELQSHGMDRVDGVSFLIDPAIRVHEFLKTGLVTGYENQLRELLTFRYSVLQKGALPPSYTGS